MPKAQQILHGKKVILGVSGGIAAYKAVDLASRLVKSGCIVTTIMTKNATKLVAPKTFEAITSQAVLVDMWNTPQDFEITHIDVRDNCDAIIVAPATANIIGKFANGICDDLLSTTLCACWRKLNLIAPAMNEQMWSNPAVHRNIEMLSQMGCQYVGPENGRLACGEDGLGRMSEPGEIVEMLAQLISQQNL